MGLAIVARYIQRDENFLRRLQTNIAKTLEENHIYLHTDEVCAVDEFVKKNLHFTSSSTKVKFEPDVPIETEWY
jgi:hypothetical protein